MVERVPHLSGEEDLSDDPVDQGGVVDEDEEEDDVSGLFLESLMKSLQLVRGGGNEGAV